MLHYRFLGGLLALSALTAPAIAADVELAWPAGHVTSAERGTLPAGGRVPAHTHPGAELVYVISGGGLLTDEGAPDRRLVAGEFAAIPAGKPHAFEGGADPTEITSTYVLEAGKPVSAPAAP